MQESETKVAKSFRAMIQGAARVLRRENAGSSRFVTFDVEDSVTHGTAHDIVKHLIKVIDVSLNQSSHADNMVESEYSYREGMIFIPRIQTDSKFLGWVNRTLGSTSRVETVLYHQPARSLKLDVVTPGLLGSLRFDDDETAAEPLKAWEIQVSARAHGVNFKDVFVALGQMRAGVGMVGEVAGIVTAVGQDMKARYNVGDRVTGFGSNPFASMPRISGNLAHTLPQSMPFTVGATIPAIYATAYYCIFNVARLRKGQSILIHAASGGVGQAAIQLAQHIGADIFATVGSAAKRKLIVEQYGIPESHVFSTRGISFKDGVLRLTGGRGVDVVLNSLSGEMLSQGLECVARLGTFVEIGKADIYKSSHLNMTPFDRSISFAAVDLVLLGEDHPEIIYEILGSVMSLFEDGALYPLTPINTIPIGNIEEAFRMIATRKHMGKIVLEADPTCTVTATVARPPSVQLARDGTYVIAGGLGDLGRRLAVFLASKAAGNIVLLSRRSIDDKDRAQLEAAVGRHGGNLHIVKCDITKEDDISDAVMYCNSLPPVRGVIHGGMVLKVGTPFHLPARKVADSSFNRTAHSRT
jgi:NADPH:quinone reductase-like Zn-dependent oxidoreductase